MLDGVVTTRAMVPLEVIDDAKGDMILTLRDVSLTDSLPRDLETDMLTSIADSERTP